MSNPSQLLACLSSLVVLVPLAGLLGACAGGGNGSVCTANADCTGDLVCVYNQGASAGVCIDPDEDHGALPAPQWGGGQQLAVITDVDVLFVIDNSGSMGEHQARLATSFDSFIAVLDAGDIKANYRIGVTTSDNGNPWCPAGTTTPEAGKLVLSSCKDRIEDFTFDIGNAHIPDLACNDICTLTSAELEVLPTTTDVDATPKPRPWLERIEGKQNIPASTGITDALACFVPQGITGCGFESPLESMYLSLVRAVNAQEAEYGFMRASSVLAVVFVTDEADCSYNEAWAEIFEQDGLRTFWSDPSATFPTSAVCWNAGVQCEGDPSNYDSCTAVDKDVSGNAGVGADAAVLHPVSRYIGLLDGLEQQKQEFNAEQEVIVALIGGVGSDGTPVYADVSATDPEFQDTFGIGPGCTGPALDPANELVEAVPPVRIRDVVNEFSAGNTFSICNEDHSDALATVAQSIQAQLRPSCYWQCAYDLDSSTPQLEPDCTVEADPPGPDNALEVLECARDANGYLTDAAGDFVMPSDELNVCYVLRSDNPDDPLTATTTDDLSSYCADQHFNLEFRIARRIGYPAVGGTSVSASCRLADDPDVSCPGIGG